ncbi:MAG: pleiotropic regulatory protein RsmS [Gammaproteobacteria bacterium]|nr:pleiotropic regulatory protein RsmS [Gammaproteobacteria bacterium]
MNDSKATENNDSLDNAPEHIKLAVDLIFLLESNEVDANVALKALDIVKADLQQKTST